MKNRYLFLFLFFLIAGCSALNGRIMKGFSTLNETAIEKTDRLSLRPLCLIPDYDIYDIRIDLIRQMNEPGINDSAEEAEAVPYHPVGFYLGNGLFIDLNDNLSLLVPKLFNINANENFTITYNQQGPISGLKITYKRTGNLFVTESSGLIKARKKEMIESKDSALFVKGGLLSGYEIVKSGGAITYESEFANTTIHKSKDGYYYNQLFGEKDYKQINNEVCIGKRYVIRNNGDMIEIMAKGLSNQEYPVYQIIESAHKIYVYNRYHRGLEITRQGDEISVKRNQRNIGFYYLKSAANM